MWFKGVNWDCCNKLTDTSEIYEIMFDEQNRDGYNKLTGHSFRHPRSD